MTVLYIREQGAQITRKHEQIRVRHKDKIISQTPVRELDQVIIYGNVQISTQAAALLTLHSVDVLFYSTTGRFRYRLQRGGSRYARLRQTQLRVADDTARSLDIARSVVAGKLKNQMRLMDIWAAGVKPSKRHLVRQARQNLNNILRQCSHAGTADQLRGYEGGAATLYFTAMRRLIPSSWGFQQRAYYPPPDPWNAVLSFGYSLLMKDVLAAIELIGLDPYVGFFHALEANRPSLALDLMEPLRPMVDDAMLRLMLSGKLPLSSFRIRPDARRPVELGKKLLPIVIEGYETALKNLQSGQSGVTPGRSVLTSQVRQFASVLLDKRNRYKPVELKFKPFPKSSRQMA